MPVSMTCQDRQVISIGPFSIGVLCEEIWLHEIIAKNYHEFIDNQEPDIIISLSLKPQLLPHPTSISLVIDDSQVEIQTPYSNLRIEMENKQGVLFTVKTLASAELELILRILFSVLAARNNGFLFHSAGILHQGAGYLFFGPSGSGKTTVARCSNQDIVLNDDLVLLTNQDDAGWRMWGTPFTNPHQVRPNALNCEVSAIFRLVQDQQVFIEPLHPALALAEVLASIPILPAYPLFTKELIKSVEYLIQKIPVNRLHFKKDCSFWSIIDQ